MLPPQVNSSLFIVKYLTRHSRVRPGRNPAPAGRCNAGHFVLPTSPGKVRGKCRLNSSPRGGLHSRYPEPSSTSYMWVLTGRSRTRQAVVYKRRQNALSVYILIFVQCFIKVNFAHEAILKGVCNTVKFVIVIDGFQYLLAVFVLGDL